MKRRVLLVLAFAGLFFAGLAAQPSRYASEIERARADAALLKAKRLPGLSVAVLISGAIVWSEGFGVADIEQQVPVTPMTRFRVGSVSKIITAAGLARLVEAGRIDLDAPIQKYVPSFPVKPWPMTVRQLAGHLAGVRHYTAKDFFGALKGAPHFDTLTAGLAIFQDDPLLFEPGTSVGYSSYGWNVIGAAMEGASGENFLDYMQRAVFDPLGLRSLTGDRVRDILPSRTRFYSRDAQGVWSNAPAVDSSYKWPSGGFLATASDLARFGSAHLRPGFLKQATLDLLFTSQRLVNGKETGVGIGWRIGVDDRGHRVFHHGGTIEGGRAMLMLFPDQQVVVAMLANVLPDTGVPDFGEADAQRIGNLFIR